jgi:hypothetical protein
MVQGQGIFWDVLSEGVIDLTVPWNRLLLPSRRVDVNIMPGTVPMKSATLLNKLPDKLRALHKASSFV